MARRAEREHLCLTVSFDHDIVDGVRAARFTTRFTVRLSQADELRGLIDRGGGARARGAVDDIGGP